MDHFLYQNRELYAEDVSISSIAAAVGTPFYVYSTATLTRHYRLFEEALSTVDHLICFAVKSNSNLAVLKTLATLGAGMDVVSGGEYARAKAAGVPGEKIVFSGVGKTREEMREALAGGVRQFNVESEPELEQLSQIAAAMGVTAPVTVRVNPDVDARTHEKIATGKAENKFGIPIERARKIYGQIAQMPALQIVGLDVHIGSQLVDIEPYRQSYRKIADLTVQLREDGHDIKRLDLGGGLGIPYETSNTPPPLPSDYGAMVIEELGHLGCEIEIEPGRLISGNAGLLVSQVLYVKDGADRQFLILDAAMNDLLRPAMYGAYHDIIAVAEPAPGLQPVPYDVVGPVCESADTFAKGRDLPTMRAGDLVAFRSAGAYGAVMASEYNSRPLIPEVLVHKDQFSVVRPRPSQEEMLARDTLPDWLG